MGRPLKIQSYSNGSGDTSRNGVGVAIDQGFNQFANLDPKTQVIPVGMTSSEFLGVVGGANAIGGQTVASTAFPVVAITANVNGQQGSAYIITQKGSHKYLVSGEDSVYANNLTQGYTYQITNLGTGTNWTALGAGSNPTAGKIFTCTQPIGTGTGNGTAADCGQCQLVTTNAISSGQMYMTFTANGNTIYASRLTNKYIFDSSNNRYATNFFVSGESTAVTLANVAIANTSGGFTCDNTNLVTGQVITISGAFTGNVGSISGYSNPTNYYVISTNNANAFVLSATVGAANVITTIGNTVISATATIAAVTTAKSGADTATWSGNNGNLTVAQVKSYTS